MKLSSYNPKVYQWVFIVLLGISSFFYLYPKIISLPPQSIHQWRQSDCLSITLNYFMEDRKFLDPSVHWTGPQDNGKTVSEFPIIYFTVAKLWKLFGYHLFYYRLLDTLILFSALFALFKFCEDLLKNSVWSIMITLLLFTSPILVYYGNNFTADVPAFSMAIIGWFFFWKFYSSEQKKWLAVSTFFFMAGTLLKASAGLSFASIGILYFLEFFNLSKFKNGEKLFRHPGIQGLILFIPLILVFSWFLYASHYNKENNYGLFLLGVLPIWGFDRVQIVETIRSLLHELMPQYFNLSATVIMVLMFAFLLIFRRKVNSMFFVIMITMFIGFGAFLILFFQVFNVHDYYLINMLIFVVFVLLTFFLFLKENYPQILNQNGLKIIFAIFVVFSMYYTSAFQKAKYFTSDSIVLDKKEVEFWKWFHWDYNNRIRAFETVTPYLRSLGIKREDKVYSIPDKSINITLCLMDQKGWTEYGYDEYNDKDFMEYILKHDAKYLIISDPEKVKEEFLQPYVTKKIGEYHNIQVFSLR
jgi:hypothetical protein